MLPTLTYQQDAVKDAAGLLVVFFFSEYTRHQVGYKIMQGIFQQPMQEYVRSFASRVLFLFAAN